MQRPPGSTVSEPPPGAGAGHGVQSAVRAENSELVVKYLEPRQRKGQGVFLVPCLKAPQGPSQPELPVALDSAFSPHPQPPIILFPSAGTCKSSLSSAPHCVLSLPGLSSCDGSCLVPHLCFQSSPIPASLSDLTGQSRSLLGDVPPLFNGAKS